MLAARREQKEDISHRRRDGGDARRPREECLLCATVHSVLSLEFGLIALVDEDDAGLRSDRTGPAAQFDRRLHFPPRPTKIPGLVGHGPPTYVYGPLIQLILPDSLPKIRINLTYE